jgi:signal recognition particle receptor subunit beta
MAVIDNDASEIVIRLVYDGPPEAGKTTSLRALAGSLAQATYTPAEDGQGRTLWFDWMEYVGGRFEGCRIRCQIVTVPGQRVLAPRRRRVIEGADVVVFVGNSSAAETPETLDYLFELRDLLAHTDGAPVGVILQANKRDLPDAVPLDELRRQLAAADWPIGVVESVAADGTGIREAFVYAVRLALDRVRELMNRGALRQAADGQPGADELLELLRADDRALHAPPPVIENAPDSPAAELLREVLAFEHEPQRASNRPASHGTPYPPDDTVPSGAIWPPVEGRAILHELTQIALVPRQLGSGDWAAGLGSGWRVVSGRTAVFPTLDLGRTALIQWARLHASATGAISARRCIVLADDGDRGWRLWQIVRADDSARELLERALREHQGEALLARITKIAQLLLDGYDKLAHLSLTLPTNLDALGGAEINAVYIGLMPDPAALAIEPRPRLEPHAWLRAQLEATIGADLRARGLDVDAVLGQLAKPARPEGIIQAITAMLGA